MGGLLAGAMMFATSVGAAANVTFCESDPPIQVVTPGGHNLQVNTQVYFARGSQQLPQAVTETSSAQPDGNGGTMITVNVFLPAPAHVVASVNRYKVSVAGDGSAVVTLYLDVPIS